MEVWEKSQTVDPEVRAYVYSLVSAVGGQSNLDDRYAVGDDALAVLNDLVRWLKLYDEKTNRFDVKRCLAEANLVKGDLLEILALWSEEEQDSKLKSKLALACLQLLVPLTWPIELDEDKTTVNHLRHAPYLQLAQVGYKRAMLHHEDAKILRTTVRIGLPSMVLTRKERSRRDDGIIRLLLYFIRNIAMITQPQHLPSQGDENDVSCSATINAFHEQDVFSLLLTIGSGASDEFQERDAEVLEILFHLLKGVDPRKLFQTQSQLETNETNALQNLMQKEKAMLNSYNKHAPTRHNRFGTMIWVKRGEEKVSTMSGQNSITNADTTLLQMDASKKIHKHRQRARDKVVELNENNELGARMELNDEARHRLRAFVEDFLDSSFNPLFGSLRKAIEREADRVSTIHHRHFFYLISWFLSAEAARRERRQHLSATQEAQEENTFAYIAAVLDQETFVLLTRELQKASDEKRWQDLQAVLLTFTQILHTVQSMSESPDDEDQEIAENIQNRIFYEEATHDLLVHILRTYKTQGFSYLDTITDCVHVFVRMLERYSKQNADLQIRSKRRARRKRKQNAQATGASLDDEEGPVEEQDEFEAHQQVRERKFDFTRFSAKFLAQGCVDTFISLLRYYQDLSSDQLKRCHRYLYRLAFKHELSIFLFRADILQLLHRMIKGPDRLNPESSLFKEMGTLVQQVFRRCIKWVERESEGEGWREAAVVEMLFSKIPGTSFYLQHGFEKVIERRAPRPPAELEIKKTVDEEKRVGVAVAILIGQAKQDAVEWIKAQLKRAAEERQAWEDSQVAIAETQRMSGDEGNTASTTQASAPTIFLSPDNEERKEALFRDKHLRLLLTTLGLHRLGTADDTSASWIIPAELTAQKLQVAITQIENTERDGLNLEEGQSIQDLIRNKSAGRRGQTFSDTDSADSDADPDAPMFPPNAREPRREGDERPKKRRLTKRNQVELTEEQVAERAKERKKREREKNSKIKSQLIVEESDDEEGDAEFFRLEDERRKKTDGMIRSQLLQEARKSGEKRSADSNEESGVMKRKRRRVSEDDVGEESDEGGLNDVSDIDMDTIIKLKALAKARRNGPFAEDSSDDENAEDAQDETPGTSSDTLDHDMEPLPALSEVSGNAAARRPGSSSKVFESEDDDDGPTLKRPLQRRNVRAGFVIEDDSDDQ